MQKQGLIAYKIRLVYSTNKPYFLRRTNCGRNKSHNALPNNNIRLR